MIDSSLFELFQDDSVDKQLKIEFDGGVITNEELHSQEFELSESLCSESELRFGSCEASSIKFKISNIFTPLKNKWLTVSVVLNGNTAEPFLIGKYKVYSDVPTADRRFRDVVAYDVMYDIINSDVADWYNTILPSEDSTVTLKEFRTSFISHFGLEQEEIKLVNDDMVVEKTVEPSEISGKDVITAICEINGCFGHIGRSRQFQWIYLKQDIKGLYPANDLYPADNLYPREPGSTRVGANGTYITASYEDFLTKSITKLQIRQEENDIGVTSPAEEITDDDNCYIIEDNFLIYGKGTAELQPIADNIMTKIKKVVYRPFEADCKGNLCFEVGDAVRLATKYEIIETYILQRTLKGIQALKDTYSAEGVETYSEQVNSVKNSIIQLKGKANILTRTIEETRQEIYDIEAGMSFSIAATAKGLETEIERATNAENALQEDYNAKLELTAEQLTSEFTAELQTWDTGNYDISFRGDEEPTISVEDGKYYLDESSGAIYAGIKTKWKPIAVYEWDDESHFYRFQYYLSGYNGGLQSSIQLSELSDGTFANVSTFKPDSSDDGYSDGDVWVEVTYMPPLYGDTITLYQNEGGSTRWELVDYAIIMDLPRMASKINQTANSIELKVSKGEVTSQLLIEPDDIYLKTGRLRIETDNLEINKDGSSGEILSRNLSEEGVTKDTARYIKLNTGGLEGGYGNVAKCKIVCTNSGFEFRGKILTFCMDSIKVGRGMDSTSLEDAYTGDVKYAILQDDGKTFKSGIMQIRNGLVLANFKTSSESYEFVRKEG